MKKYIKTLAFGLALTCAAPAMAQNGNVVQGTVVDENGEPVIGATVRLEGTNKAVVTDLEGNYKIEVPAKSKLTVSYIGYKNITTTGGRAQLASSNTDLQEVVAVGYASQKKAHLTGSVVTVPMEEIQDLANGDLASSLIGLVNGVSINQSDARHPGEHARITIRTAGSLGDIGSTVQQPLFVIDGYIYPNDIKVGNATQNLGAEAFNNLDASEVESISILKDASAAVYGARAANGVILVTTKKGKVGAPRISYSGQFGFTDEVARPKMLDAYNYGRLYNIIQAKDPTNTSMNKTTSFFQADELEAMKDLNYDLLDKYWETGTTMRHSINVSGATDKVNYFAGISYFDQEGNLGKLDYDRWNFRAGVDVKVSKWLGANVTVSGNYGKKDAPLIKVGGTNKEKDYTLLLSRPYYIPEEVGGYPIPTYGPSNSGGNGDQDYNFAVLQNNGDYKRNRTSDVNISGSLNYDFGWSKILKGLTLRFNYSKSINNAKGNEYGSSYKLYQMVSRYGSGNHLYTPTTGDDPDFDYLADANFIPLTKGNGNYLYRSMTRTDNYQMNFTANYARDFGLHHVSALFSIEKSEAESEYLTGQREKPYSFTTGQYNSATGDMSTTFTRSESGSLSYIGRLNYAYDSRYLFEFIMRADASTKFHKDNRWGYFPSVSAGWIISEEDWFKDNVKWADFLKVRASYGLTGRDNTAPWQWMQIYAQDANKGTVFGEGMGNDSSNRITINKNNSAVNTEVGWDKSYKMNIGVDARFLDNRLSVTFDAYREWNRDMLLNLAQNVASTIGTQSAAINRGEMNNWGYELSLTWRDKIGKDFKYRVGLNTGYSDNEVLNMDWETEYLYRQIVKGDRTDQGLWGMQCIGMFRSNQDIEEYFAENNITSYLGKSKDQVRPGMLIYKDVRGAQQPDGSYAGPNGIIDIEEDQVQLSNRSNPYGFTTNLGAEWKGLSLTAQLGASWGGYELLPSDARSGLGNIAYNNMPSFWNPDDVFVYQNIYDGAGNLIQAQNREAKYPNPGFTENSIASSFWRVSSTNVQLRRVTLAYTLPKEWTAGWGIHNVRINVTGQNLINFYNPYPDNFTSPMAGSFGRYPALRKWTVGVNLSF